MTALDWDQAQEIATATLANLQSGMHSKMAVAGVIDPASIPTKHDYRLSAILDAIVAEKYTDPTGKNAKRWRSGVDRKLLPHWGDTRVMDLTVAEQKPVLLQYYRECPGEGSMGI